MQPLPALLALVIALVHSADAKLDYVKCERTYRKIGCFNQNLSPAQTYLINDRDPSSKYFQGHVISWHEFEESIHSLACRCHEKAKQMGFKFFAIRYFGECVGGADERKLVELLKQGKGMSNKCSNVQFQKCTSHVSGTECVGEANSDYLYRVATGDGANVNGGYTEWSEYGPCSVTCGEGVKARERMCTNPEPSGNGASCEGRSTETLACKLANCPIDGGYSQWSQYEECSKSCGIGIAKRTRYCTNPRPSNGGKDCSNGPVHTDTKPCKKTECAVDGEWSSWSGPSKCSKSCEDGIITYTRTCSNPAPKYGGNDCDGDAEKYEKCSNPGKMCPIDGGLSAWTSYTPCSETCGNGIKTRTRKCNNPAPKYGGKACVGSLVENAQCKLMECPVDGGWTAWSSYSECSETCGLGEKVRTRSCTNPTPAHKGEDCIGEAKETVECKLKECAVDGGFSPWSIFSKCSTDCGEGKKTRTRSCTNPAPAFGGKECSGPVLDEQKCVVVDCPVDGGFSEWSEFSSCSTTCDIGVKRRTRTCTNPAPENNGKECMGSYFEEWQCKIKDCPVDGGFGPWGDYGVCSVTCGGGLQKKERACTNPPPRYGGKPCEGQSVITKECSTDPCPVDGGWSQFTPYGNCSKDCGLGKQERTRTCTSPVPKHGGGKCIGDASQAKECKIKECPIDGGFSDWSAFSICSETCGDGVQKRVRKCNNPEPEFGGKVCIGKTEETRNCKLKECPVDGGFTQWSSYSACSASCGDGEQKRTRECTNPKPAYGGDECVGETEQIRDCKLKECPIDGGISSWSAYGECSETCGEGSQERTRTCTNPPPQHGGKDCSESRSEKRKCKIKECPVNGGWAAWSNFYPCSVLCGPGTQMRRRSCNNPEPAHGGDDCVGSVINVKPCKLKECPIDGEYTPWGPFGPCSKTCGDGSQERTRTCTNPAPAHGGKGCEGPPKNSRSCKVIECPIDGGLSQWSSYGKCSAECGPGTQERSRSCTNPTPAHGGAECEGDMKESRDCEIKPCPIDGGFTEWSDFSVCSVTCGSGTQKRQRACTNPVPQHGGEECSGSTLETRKCDMKPCPVNGGYTSWTAYGACSETCGEGIQIRSRQCTNPYPAHGGDDCVGVDNEEKSCKLRECPVNGGYTPWGAYGPCSETCGNGQQERTRKCTNPAPAHGGKGCIEPAKSSRACKVKECPIDGGLSQWSMYGKCSEECGKGVQERTRECNNPKPQHGGADCVGEMSESRGCQVKPCPVDGGFSNWSGYGLCSVTCGTGTQERTRECNNPAPVHGGKECSGEVKESRKCDMKPCPVNGGFGQWSIYGECSETCGEGTQERTRKCNNPAPAHGGDDCTGEKEQNRSCKVKECPVDGGYSAWSEFSKCSTTCGDGLKKRTRTCNNPSPAYSGKACQGAAEEEEDCKLRECPVDGGFTQWSSYSACSKTCGDGIQDRTRSCTEPAPAHGGKKCEGKTKESKKCNLRSCPINGGFTAWSKFDECSELCGGGDQERTRTCTNPRPQHGGKNCEGPESETRDCNTQKCKINGGYGQWSKFSKCSETCGQGKQTRTRKCVETRRDCSGPSKQTRICKVKECPIDGGLSQWSPYSACSKTCGEGSQERTRTCTNPPPQHGGKDCSANLKQSRKCKVKECPVNGGFTKWSSFGACSETCGEGIQQRFRYCTNPKPEHGGQKCRGAYVNKRKCNLRECPVNGKWGKWGPYGECSKPCGGGVKEKFRKCNAPAPAHGGKKCAGFAKMVMVCNLHKCPVDGGFSEWSGYTACSKTCGTGSQYRTRQCNSPKPAHGGKDCSGNLKETKQCKVRECPIDGGYTQWTSYSACSKSCGKGFQKRTRSCTNPAPAHGGAKCVGFNVEERPCKVKACPVNGNWGAWGEYGQCSKSCGGGIKERFRQCSNPAPAHGGKACAGSAKYFSVCSMIPCPVDGGYSKWTSFSECTRSCGLGTRTRTRKCTNPSPKYGGKKCAGPSSHIVKCKLKECPIDGGLSSWSSYSTCSKTCGEGSQERTRTCTNPTPQHGGKDCSDDLKQSRKCKVKECPVNGRFTRWSSYSACSKTCGLGRQTKRRTCTNPAPAHGGKKCVGRTSYSRYCRVRYCPVNGNWGPWGSYGGCSQKCGGGVQERFRQCVKPAPRHGGKKCAGFAKTVKVCNLHKCPVDGGVSSWSSYSACSKTCGVGTQQRTRTCTNPAPAHGGKNCKEELSEARKCKVKECPVNGGFTTWTPFSACSKTCGSGVQVRTRSCTNPTPAHGGSECSGNTIDSRPCKVKECPVNGGLTEWSSYTECSVTCGVGTWRRRRSCTNPEPKFGGRNCQGHTAETKKCQKKRCPINGQWGTWGQYGGCSKTCGGGVMERFRACNSPSAQFGGKKCPGSNRSVKLCNTNKCPVHGQWGPWLAFGPCTVSCDGGIQHRIRKCNNPAPAYGGRECEGPNRWQRGCAYDRCPIHGKWGAWGQFTACTKSCGTGTKSRDRLCNSPSPSYGGNTCSEDARNVEKCNTQPCSVDGGWGKWTSFGKCTKTCGGGMATRTRKCDSPAPLNGGKQCEGISTDTEPCNKNKCPVNGGWGRWSSYGSCSKTCGSGVKERSRKCNNPAPAHGGKKCPGSNRGVAVCATWRCPINGEWAPWGSFGPCNVQCGGGYKERHRSCTAPSPRYGGRHCIGHQKHIAYCNYQPCKVDGKWGSWSSYGDCSAYCDGGEKKRYRYCNSPSPAHGGKKCVGTSGQTAKCNEHRCPIHGQWGTWSRYGMCDKKCGGGMQERKRECNSPAPQFGGRPCEGPASNKRPCNTQGCKVDGQWGPYGRYGECSSSCGGGVQEKFRYCNNPAPQYGGKNCEGFAKMVRVCNMIPCRGWSAWGAWGACTLPCNGGVRFRFRNCYTMPCPGSQSQVGACNTKRCRGRK